MVSSQWWFKISEGTGFRDQMSNHITAYGTSATLTPRTRTTGNYGGYSGGSYTNGTSSTIKVIPSKNVTSPSGEMIGKVTGGDLKVVIRYDVTIDKYSLLTYKSTNYEVEDIDEIYLQDVIVAKRITLKEELS